ncbi:D-3-phosphoglycerate dehydrogenase [Mycolicibacterium sp. BK556]|uniref:phosphoglycerate dehydrogenase n=1 Tax=Mycobacteriaceae TaxID=1762 RepID=UPI0010605012|nr:MULTISPECIES: phosphoglycerate dehydrogenase [Mycobacteriaceae]MBB3607019.1 D-3-phosphoglycerate dehydrogenase [Mycolicibacterium sp. BK556]MBB3636768.1 D-3-phosphoglycerate dehydrogenase [Mycolicibacterium sp. BK607]MBB3747569.1 D-3-phosphoglycerate dehydrogenase [Mycolicibacterium sp. BK634]TDO08293.1 D-3-phosphoglycerate dehydrogenase [Mycobacterium sp. BK086]
MSAPLVLVTCRQMQVELPRHRERIESLGYEVIAPDLGGRQQFTAAELLEHGDSRLVGIIAGDDELDSEFFAGAHNLKTVIRWGIGMDSVDHEAARRHGVRVRNTPGVFGQEVADSAFGYILNLARGYITVDSAVRRGEWPKWEGFTLAGSRLGVVGFGAIGREIAKRGRGFDMDVVAYDPFVDSDADTAIVDLSTLLATSRFIVMACPLTAETFHLIDAQALAVVQPDAYLVNVARGPVVHEVALIDALTDKRLAGAALDVFESEPLPMDSPLRTLPNVVLGAHNGSNTRQGVERASAAAVDFLIEELSR